MFAFCSIDGSASIANRHRTIHDEGPQRTVSPCPLSASIITCLKCANDPTPTPCVCLYPRYPRKLKPTEMITPRHPPPANPELYLVRLYHPHPPARDSRFTNFNDASFWRGILTESDERLLIPHKIISTENSRKTLVRLAVSPRSVLDVLVRARTTEERRRGKKKRDW